MSDINIPPFYVGQRVVCINDNPQLNLPIVISSGVKELENGIVYTVSELTQSKLTGYWYCWLKEKPIDLNWKGFHCSRFAPVEENFQSITYEKVMEKESPLISVN